MISIVRRLIDKATIPSFRRAGGASAMLLLLLFSFLACDDYDTFTTDRSSVLTFSSDSIVFDTLLATVPSSTKTLIVYNRGDKGVRINEVRLNGGHASPFRINVDGQDISRTADNRATDFEVRRRDSIIVRIEVTVPEQVSDDITKVDDILTFTLENGMAQQVSLIVSGRNAFFLKGTTLRADTTFTSRRPIVVYDSLVVAPDVTLTLEAGTQLLFHDKAGLVVHGTLIAKGTLEAPVILRGDRTDHMFDYLPYDRMPNRWEGLVFTPESHDNRLDYLDLHSGSYGIRCDSTGTDALKLQLINSLIHNVGEHGLELRHCRSEFVNTEVSNAQGHCAYVIGGDAQFIHCTLARFGTLTSYGLPAVNITNQDSIGYFALDRADFINCVVTGYADDALLIPSLNREDMPSAAADLPINYHFLHCFLTTEVPEDELYADRFVNCRTDSLEADINREKHFQVIDGHNFLYDFTPVEASPIRGVALPTYSALYPLDRYGRSRTADGAPDAGCYEFVATSKE